MIKLEPLSTKNRDYVREIRNANRKYFFDQTEVGMTDHYRWYTSVFYRKEFYFYIIMDNDKQIGTISVYNKKAYMELGNVIIDEKYRGKGYFKKALELISLKFTKKPLMIEVRADNATALKVYQKLGFTPKSIQLWK